MKTDKYKLLCKASIFFSAFFSAQAFSVQEENWMERIELGGYIAQGWQSALEVDGDSAIVSDEDASSGFQRLRFAIHVNAQITENISVFAELAEEPNDFSGITMFSISQDLAWIAYRPDEYNEIRLGNVIAYPGSMAFLKYSDGAVVQPNPLIGNSPIDMITAEEGLWLTGGREMGPGKLMWDATISTPSFFSDFSEDSGYDYKGNLTYELSNGFGFGAGVFRTTSDADCLGGICTLSNGAATGSQIGLGDGDNYEFSTGGPATRATHVAIIPGIKATIAQVDFHYKNEKLMLHALLGVAEDDYSFLNGFGSTQFEKEDSEMRYLGLTGQYNVSDNLYFAARYSLSENESDGVSSDENRLDRIQVGLGYWFDDAVLLKAEYVKQTEEENSGGLKTNGLGEADWDGFSLELSMRF